MELDTSKTETTFIVELKECTEFESDLLVELGYVLMPLYWRMNDHPHTVGNLIILRRIEFQCVAGHTPRLGLSVVQKKMQMLADITRKAALGGTPSRFDPAKDSLPSLETGGQIMSLGDGSGQKRKLSGW